MGIRRIAAGFVFRYTAAVMARSSRPRISPLPLRWLLALVLILNGAVSPPVAADVPASDAESRAATAASVHCHEHRAAAAATLTHAHKHPCPCCADGAACQCGCVVALALPLAFPDLRPLPPSTLATPPQVPDWAAAPRHHLLRPPIA